MHELEINNYTLSFPSIRFVHVCSVMGQAPAVKPTESKANSALSAWFGVMNLSSSDEINSKND